MRALFVAVVCLFAPLASAQMIQGGAAGVIPSGLGGPHYAFARTDKAFIPIPAVMPNVGNATGAGTCVAQPGYANSEVCRVTDINTRASAGSVGQQEFSTCCGGSADYPAWSADSRMVWIEDASGEAFLFRIDDSVDPPIFSCVGSGDVWVTPATSCITIGSWLGGGAAPVDGVEWSATDPLTFYGEEGSSQMWKFVLHQGTAAQPTATELFDLSTAPNCAPSLGASTGPFRVTWDGNDFGGIYSKFAQGSQYQVFYYDLAQGCRWMNTLTWQVGGNWGPTGTATMAANAPVTNSAIASDIATLTVSGPAATALPLSFSNPSTFTVTNATNASPIVLTTSTSCGCNNLLVGVTGVLGNTAANGTWLASVSGTSVTLLNLDGSNSTGNGAYTSGGTLYHGNYIDVSGLTNCAACNGGPFQITSVSGQNVSYAVNAANVTSGADSGTVKVAEQLHEMTMTGNGTMLLSASSTTTNTRGYWSPGTLNVSAQQSLFHGSGNSNSNSGHYAPEFSHVASNSQGAGDLSFCQYAVMTLDVPAETSFTFLMPTAASCFFSGTIQSDNHESITTLTQADNFPVFEESINQTGSPINTVAKAGVQEILGHSYSTMGKISRFCASYQDTSVGNGGQNFTAWDGVGTVSPNGKWFIFASDWGSTLGTDMGGHLRADVFLCRLR